MSLTVEEKRIVKQYAYQGADFMFVPSSFLRELIIKDHPMTKNINPDLKTFLLEGKAIRIDPEMIKMYCDNKLSSANTWLLDKGDIKVELKKITIK
jgi:hypothetical protein